VPHPAVVKDVIAAGAHVKSSVEIVEVVLRQWQWLISWWLLEFSLRKEPPCGRVRDVKPIP